jgi:hypothetical protein
MSSDTRFSIANRNHRMQYGRLQRVALSLALLFTAAGPTRPVCGDDVRESQVIRLESPLPDRPPVTLRKIASLTRPAADAADNRTGPGRENSGIVRSRSRDDLFWVHNDSGDDPRVYAIHADGSDYQSSRYSASPGVLLGGAINVDWEDITINNRNELIVADVGNNRNDRRDLRIYVVPEPSPLASRSSVFQSYFIRYPEQTAFPAAQDNFNFDCEGVFTVDDTIYLCSKNRSDRLCTVYRLDNPRPDRTNTLVPVSTLDLQGQVVGADADTDGLRLVLITYKAIWLFERASRDASFFDGSWHWAPYESPQVEAVCFADADTLKLVDEATGVMYEVAIEDLTRVRTARVGDFPDVSADRR